MPEYIASGKDAYHESSIKVSADSDQEAFAKAKENLPVVCGLERIESDGSLTPVHGIPFDSMRTELTPPEVFREQQGAAARKHAQTRKMLTVLILLFILWKMGDCALHQGQELVKKVPEALRSEPE